MKKTFFYSLASFLLLFAYNTYGQNFVQVNKSNSGQTIHIVQDQVLEVQLPRKASTGYIWCEATSSDDKTPMLPITRIGESDFIHDNLTGTSVNGGMVGQSGTQIIRFIGTASGTTTLTLELKRPWDKLSPAADNYTITVVSAGQYTGTYTPPAKTLPVHTTSTPKAIPSKWDWRSQCTPITDQMSCGDCWAYAGVATLECNIKIHDGVNRDISEEYVTDCYTGNGCNGCSGGFCPHEVWLSPKGAVYESEDPWTISEGNGTTGTCGSGYAYHETIDSYADVAGEDGNGIPPDANMKAAIYNYGPIYIAIDASSNAWSSYSGGIFTENGTNTDHAVALVGWCDSTGIAGGGYWILRNSWGLGWGVNGTGYMYISYGSDAVGTMANYIVYKGGISHTIAPVANFGVASLSSCTGKIQFLDSSRNSPTTWHWSFGDGDTSNLQNPVHIYTSSQTYSVSLKAVNAYGNNTLTKTSYITISLPASPMVTNGSAVSGGSATMTASGSGTLNWYNAATGGTLVNIGPSYTISPLTSSQTFYVENDIVQPTNSVGMATSTLNTSTGGYYTLNGLQGLVFDAYQPLTIKTVTVYEQTAGTRTIWLKNYYGILDSLVTTVAAGMHTITLNFTVPAGTGYILGANVNNGFWRETTDASFPYNIANVMSITGNTASDAVHYYYFYNWQVQQTPCTSARVPVTATLTTGIDEFADGKINLYPNPNTGSFDISLDENYQNVSISIINLLGQTLFQQNYTGSNLIHVDAPDVRKGIYFIELKTEHNVFLRKITIMK